MHKMMLLAGVVAVLLTAGCTIDGSTTTVAEPSALSAEQTTAVATWKGLSPPVRTALLAKNLVGMTVAVKGDSSRAGMMAAVLITNGATRSDVKTADLVVEYIDQTLSKPAVAAIRDRLGNCYAAGTNDLLGDFAQSVATMLGIERNVKILHPELTKK